MALGIVLHGANPYAPGAQWLVVDPNQSTLLGYVVEWVHMFRMPAFFVVAGFFAALTLGRAPRGKYLRKRATRLLVPLVVALVLFNIPQNAFLAWWAHEYCADAANCAANLTSGAWMSHLWFLVYLIGYSLLLAASWPLVAPVLDWIRSPQVLQASGAIFGFVGFAALGGLGVAAAAFVLPVLYTDMFGFLTPYKFLFYLNFFVLGVIAGANGFSRETLIFPTRRGWLALFVCALVLLTIQTAVADQGGMAATAANVFADAGWRGVTALASIWLLIYAFREPNPALRLLADASYTVYLVHHLCIIVIGLWLTTVDWPAMIKFFVNVSVTLGICLIVHLRVVAPHRYVRLALNGA